MSGIKRKDAGVPLGGKYASKKQKVGHKGGQRKKQPEFNETETDSDPIVESDTTEHSGVDDGMSWPSEEEAEVEPIDENSGKSRHSPQAELAESRSQQNNQGEKIQGEAEPSNELPTKSRESHAKQKATHQERKAAKPNADYLARSKKIWERLRRQSHVPLQERKELVAELFDIITGRVRDFVLKHDASRVVQTAIKYGNLEQRKLIARELKGEFCHLAQSKFAKHMIGKLLVHGDDEIRDLVIPEFYGSVRRMIRHPEAAWILDDVYRGAATAKQKAVLLREWYGAEYALFQQEASQEPNADLSRLLEMRPEKRGPTMRYLFEMINQPTQKKTTGFTMLHDAMLQYYLNIRSDTEASTEFLEIVKGDEEGDLLKNLAFTKSGSRLVSLLFAYSGAKDRKILLRAFRGVMEAMAGDACAHQVLLVALDVIDDTKLAAKSIYSELVPEPKEGNQSASNNILEYVFHQYARVPILYPFAHKLASILPTDTKRLLDEIHKIRSDTSKKEPEIRRKELAKSIAPQLLSIITDRAADLLKSTFGCQYVSEALLACSGAVISPAERVPPMQAILKEIKSQDTSGNAVPAAVGRMMKSLVTSGHFDPKSKEVEVCQPPLGFADMLYDCLDGRVASWAEGPNSFVVLGMLETKDMKNRDNLVKMLKGEQKTLENAAKDGQDGKPNKGSQLILQKL